MLQQVIAQVLSSILEEKISDKSYGFRPNRSAKQAVLEYKEYMDNGYKWIIDVGLETYFDTVIKAYNILCQKKNKILLTHKKNDDILTKSLKQDDKALYGEVPKRS